jgi:hypothetical protein
MIGLLGLLGRKGLLLRPFNNALQTKTPVNNCKMFWALELAANITIFLWLVMWGKILTKDNLKNNRWQGPTQCMFCAVDEGIDHLFFRCPVARLHLGCFHLCF